MAPLAVRLRDARNIARHPKIIVKRSWTELGTRFTAETLRALKRRFSRTHFVWLMGAENLQQLPRWRAWADIFRLVPVAVFRRPLYVPVTARARPRSASSAAGKRPPAKG